MNNSRLQKSILELFPLKKLASGVLKQLADFIKEILHLVYRRLPLLHSYFFLFII
jgi:hypothetical protein